MPRRYAITDRATPQATLIEAGFSPLRLQRWMGHHCAAFTIEAYGHLLDGELGPPFDIRRELGERQGSKPTAQKPACPTYVPPKGLCPGQTN